MAEYIEREAFLKDIKARYCSPCEAAEKDYNGCKCRACWVDDMTDEIIDVPAANVVPVVHGRWEMRRNSWYCVNCNKGYKITYGLLAASAYNYCPNCGAKMDEEGIK